MLCTQSPLPDSNVFKSEWPNRIFQSKSLVGRSKLKMWTSFIQTSTRSYDNQYSQKENCHCTLLQESHDHIFVDFQSATVDNCDTLVAPFGEFHFMRVCTLFSPKQINYQQICRYCKTTKSSVRGHWEDVTNRRDYVKWLEGELGVKKLEDWYNIQNEKVLAKGGRSILRYFNWSLR